jgi:hypothetical protein
MTFRRWCSDAFHTLSWLEARAYFASTQHSAGFLPDVVGAFFRSLVRLGGNELKVSCWIVKEQAL